MFIVICVNVHLIFIEIMFSLLVSVQINQIAHETFEHDFTAKINTQTNQQKKLISYSNCHRKVELNNF